MEKALFPKSSMLLRAEYDKVTRIMYITFKNNRKYQFYNVPNDIWEEFINAESKGRFFTNNIKGKYKYLG